MLHRIQRAEKKAEKAEKKTALRQQKAAAKTKSFELLTIDTALTFLVHNDGKEALLHELNALVGFGKDCTFQMVIKALHEAMDRPAIEPHGEQSSTAVGQMCTVLNAAQVIIVHTASGTKTWQLHISDQEKTNIDSTHLGRLAAALGVSGLNAMSFNAYKVLQKICKVFCKHAGEGILMKFTLETVYQQEAEQLWIDAAEIQGKVADAHNVGVDAEMTYIIICQGHD